MKHLRLSPLYLALVLGPCFPGPGANAQIPAEDGLIDAIAPEMPPEDGDTIDEAEAQRRLQELRVSEADAQRRLKELRVSEADARKRLEELRVDELDARQRLEELREEAERLRERPMMPPEDGPANPTPPGAGGPADRGADEP